MKPKYLVLALLGTLSALTAQAADPVTDAMTAAYQPYRAVLFKTNSRSQADSEATIAQASQAWQALVAQYSKTPPAPYDRDSQFGQALQEVGAVYTKASDEIHAHKLAEAHETLEQARDLMAELRRRNQIIVYSDHMNAYHAEMEQMLGHGPEWTGQAQGFLLLMAKMGTLEFLAARLRTEAPPELATNPAFGPALKAVDQSLATLREAILAQDATRVREAIPKIKAPYSQLFLKFG